MRNLPNGFDTYLAYFKTLKKIAQILVAFSEKLNFNKLLEREVAETTNAIWV